MLLSQPDHPRDRANARGKRRTHRHMTLSIARLRDVAVPGRYTELFFLDEAVALAAGHRPRAMPPRRLPVVPHGLDSGPRPPRETCR